MPCTRDALVASSPLLAPLCCCRVTAWDLISINAGVSEAEETALKTMPEHRGTLHSQALCQGNSSFHVFPLKLKIDLMSDASYGHGHVDILTQKSVLSYRLPSPKLGRGMEKRLRAGVLCFICSKLPRRQHSRTAFHPESTTVLASVVLFHTQVTNKLEQILHLSPWRKTSRLP